VTQIVASRIPDLAFAIANSGPGISPPDQDLYGVEHMLREEGKSEADIARAIEFMQAIHVAARRQDDYATVSRNVLDAARGQPWASYLTIAEADDWGLVFGSSPKRTHRSRRYPESAARSCPSLARLTCSYRRTRARKLSVKRCMPPAIPT